MDASTLHLPLRFHSSLSPPTSTSLRISLLTYPAALRSKFPLPQGSLSPPSSHSLCVYSPRLWRHRRRAFVEFPAAVQKSEEQRTGRDVHGELPPEFYDDEWQARQREKTKEWHAYRQKEEDEEKKKTNEYREIGMRLKGYPEEEVQEARKLVSSFIRAAEEVEVKIEEAAEKGELTELVLMVIWNRLDLARRDDEKDAIRSLDLLYRRVETEILKMESTPSMRLLNDLLNLHDGTDDEGWLKKCRKCMIDTFPHEDPFSMLVPPGFDLEKHQGRIELPPEDDELLLRVDFVREIDMLLQEVRAEQNSLQAPEGLEPESVATRLKQQEKQRTIRQVEALLHLAVSLKW